jgi:hypothetical protein
MQQHPAPELAETELAVLRALAAAAAGTSTNPSIYRTPEQLSAVTGRSLGAVLGAVRQLSYARGFVVPMTPGGPWSDGLSISELGGAALDTRERASVPPATPAAKLSSWEGGGGD